MGNCSGSRPNEGCHRPTHDGCFTHEGHPPLDRKERYDQLKIILSESYDTVYELQDTYAKKVCLKGRILEVIKNTVTSFSMMTQLSDEEAKQIGNKTNEALEKYWLRCSKKIILSVIHRLNQVKFQKDKNDSQTNLTGDQLKKLNDLLDNLNKNCLPLLKVDQSSNDAQKTDERETNSSSVERKKDSINSPWKDGESESIYGQRTDDQHENVPARISKGQGTNPEKGHLTRDMIL